MLTTRVVSPAWVTDDDINRPGMVNSLHLEAQWQTPWHGDAEPLCSTFCAAVQKGRFQDLQANVVLCTVLQGKDSRRLALY